MSNPNPVPPSVQAKVSEPSLKDVELAARIIDDIMPISIPGVVAHVAKLLAAHRLQGEGSKPAPVVAESVVSALGIDYDNPLHYPLRAAIRDAIKGTFDPSKFSPPKPEPESRVVEAARAFRKAWVMQPQREDDPNLHITRAFFKTLDALAPTPQAGPVGEKKIGGLTESEMNAIDDAAEKAYQQTDPPKPQHEGWRERCPIGRHAKGWMIENRDRTLALDSVTNAWVAFDLARGFFSESAARQALRSAPPTPDLTPEGTQP